MLGRLVGGLVGRLVGGPRPGSSTDSSASLMGEGVPRRMSSVEVPRFANGQGLELAARQAVDGLYAGRHRSPRLGSSLDFADHRPYQDGDELRAIDWKAYARTDRLLVRRWHDDRQLPVALLLDTSASMAYGAPAKGEVARLAAAILGLLTLDQGDRLRLFITGKSERSEPTDAVHLCTVLSGAIDSGSATVPQIMTVAGERLAQRHLVIVLSDLLDNPAAFTAAAASLSARGHELACLQILDRSELALPATWGPSRFTDPEGDLSAIDGDASDLAASYAAAFSAHQEQLAAACAGLRADHLLLPTDSNPTELLGGWLARRALTRRGAGR